MFVFSYPGCWKALGLAAGMAVASLWSLGCYQQPSTLGLICEADEHCDQGQHCLSGACVAGEKTEEDTQKHDDSGTTTMKEPRKCSALYPVSCGDFEGAKCCPRKKPFCCNNECYETAKQCDKAISTFECPEKYPKCTKCNEDELFCPENAPYCCFENNQGRCYRYAGMCKGYAGNRCQEKDKPISCGNDVCCPVSQPFCCSDGKCYADPEQCGQTTKKSCPSPGEVSCGEVGCCPADAPFCCPGRKGGSARCFVDPFLCGVNN